MTVRRQDSMTHCIHRVKTYTATDSAQSSASRRWSGHSQALPHLLSTLPYLWLSTERLALFSIPADELAAEGSWGLEGECCSDVTGVLRCHQLVLLKSICEPLERRSWHGGWSLLANEGLHLRYISAAVAAHETEFESSAYGSVDHAWAHGYERKVGLLGSDSSEENGHRCRCQQSRQSTHLHRLFMAALPALYGPHVGTLPVAAPELMKTTRPP